MAGHSKWTNIKHKKANSDIKRGKIWTKLIREITIAAKLGGNDLANNARLRLAYEKALDANIPKDTIQRAINRPTNNTDTKNFEEIRYEGYGPFSIAIIIDCLTDNKIRVVSKLRHLFTKYGGQLSQNGSVAFQFTCYAQFLYTESQSSDKLLEILVENNINSNLTELDSGHIAITCPPNDYLTFKKILTEKCYPPNETSLILKPNINIILSNEQTLIIKSLIASIEELDDVQNIYTNATFTKNN